MAKSHTLLVQDCKPAPSGRGVVLTFGCKACPDYRDDETWGETRVRAEGSASDHVTSHAAMFGGRNAVHVAVDRALGGRV
jgi:hypothetical protein